MSSETVMSLREHLSELKSRFKVAFTSFAAILAILLVVPQDPAALLTGGYTSFRPLIGYFISSIDSQLLPKKWILIASGGLSEPLEIYLVVSVLFALIFNAPIFAYETIKFVGPALNEREKSLIYPFVGANAALFAFGSAFGYFFLAKFLLVALTPFFVTTGISPYVDAGSFYFTVVLTIAMSGFAFTVPVYVYTLIVLGVVQAASFRKNRLIIWAVTYIGTAIITPDGGPLLDVILFIPIITLLELAVFIGGRSRDRRLRKMAQEGPSETPASAGGQPPPPPSPASPALPSPQAATASAPPGTAAVTAAPATPGQAQSRPCPYCQFAIPPGTLFCPNCGKSSE